MFISRLNTVETVFNKGKMRHKIKYILYLCNDVENNNYNDKLLAYTYLIY